MRSTLLIAALAGSAISLVAVASSHPGTPRMPSAGQTGGTLNGPPAFASGTVVPARSGPEITRDPSWVTERSVDGPPVSLTASDGSGLTLAELEASAVVEGPLAFTEMHLAFDNPENRTREGTFKIVLPQGASLGRFAMKIGDVWQEGEVVPKERARRAYEDALHRKQDPALLERGAGNEFTARVFPIPARGRKEIIVSYAQELVGGAPYGLPLRGLPELGVLDISVGGEGVTPQHLHNEHFVPSTDFVMEDTRGPRPSPMALRSGNLVVARVRPVAEALPDPVKGAIVLIDTSASRALGLASELEEVERILRGLGERHGAAIPVSVAAFDQEVVPVYQGDAMGFSGAAMDRITARKALGASNIEAALAWAKDEAKKTGATRVILVTDAVPTAGEDDGAKLAKAATALREGGAERLDVVAVGGLRDDALARKLVTAGLAHDGVVVPGTESVATLVRRLEAGTRSDVAVAVEGASWSYPTRLDGVQPGDEVLVYAELPEGEPLRVRVGDGKSPALGFDATPADRPLVERAWAQAKIESLEAEERNQGKSPEVERKIVALSTSHRVLSNYTALLVLESDADYARFQIDRRALSDILTVDAGQLAWLKRGAGPQGLVAKNSIPGDTWKGTDKPADAEKDKKEIAPPARTAAAERAIAPQPSPMTASATPMSPPAAGKAATLDEEADTLQGQTLGALGGAAAPAGAAAGPAAGRGGGDLSGSGEGIGLGSAGTIGHGFGRSAPHRDDANAENGGTGTRARGEEGSMGNPSSAPLASAAAPPVDLSVAAPTPTVAALPTPVTPPPAAHMARGSAGLALGAASGGGAVLDGRDASGVDPFTGKFKEVKDHLARNDVSGALAIASSWQSSAPGDVLALVSLGEASEARGDVTTAARAYGSIIDLFPSRADLRRFAGERLEHIKGAQTKSALELAIDTFDKARRDRPDHPASHRLAAFARVRRGEYAAAFDIVLAGLAQHYPEGRFRGVDQILREDLGLVAAAWMKADPSRKSDILARLRSAGGSIEDAPSIRFVLNWETDANDVDFHIHDALGGHAYYASPHLPSGGDLYADVTTGYGPECFTVREAKGNRAGPYSLQAHYFSRGPMGYGMGKLEIIDHDGHGGLKFEERPFVVMADHAFVNLGTVD